MCILFDFGCLQIGISKIVFDDLSKYFYDFVEGLNCSYKYKKKLFLANLFALNFFTSGFSLFDNNAY